VATVKVMMTSLHLSLQVLGSNVLCIYSWSCEPTATLHECKHWNLNKTNVNELGSPWLVVDFMLSDFRLL
jgi:hypothetical protein